MNKGIKPMHANLRKKMRKQVKKDIKESINSKVESKAETISLEQKERLKTIKKEIQSKKKRKQPKVIPGKNTAKHAQPEGLRWLNTAKKQILNAARSLGKHLLKVKR